MKHTSFPVAAVTFELLGLVVVAIAAPVYRQTPTWNVYFAIAMGVGFFAVGAARVAMTLIDLIAERSEE